MCYKIYYSIFKEWHAYRIITLQTGAVIGEMSLLENSARAASICTLIECKLLSLPIHELLSFAKDGSVEDPLIYFKIVENIGKELRARLRQVNQVLAETLHSEKIQKEGSNAQHSLFTILGNF